MHLPLFSLEEHYALIFEASPKYLETDLGHLVMSYFHFFLGFAYFVVFLFLWNLQI